MHWQSDLALHSWSAKSCAKEWLVLAFAMTTLWIGGDVWIGVTSLLYATL